MIPAIYKNIATFYAPDAAAWHTWLAQRHATQQGVWLVMYKKQSATPSIYYPEAVDEALCWGWIDSKPNKRDDESYYQFFSPRQPKSNWSRVNKEKVDRLSAQQRIQAAGWAMIELAKQTGTWTALDDVENLLLPPDLQTAFAHNDTAYQHWQAFSRSARRGILEWLLQAKTPATRQKRIGEIVGLAQQNQKANQYQRPK